MSNVYTPIQRLRARLLTRVRKLLGLNMANNHVTSRPWLWWKS